MDFLSQFEVEVIKIPTPWTAGPTNSYVVKRDQTIIIDTGVKYGQNLNNFLEALKEKKVELNNSAILITHGHTDHYGFAQSLSRILTTQVIIPAREIPKTTEDFFERMKKAIDTNRNFFLSTGMPEDLFPVLYFIPEQNSALREPLHNPAVMPEKMKVGETIEIIPLPGHTSGHVGLFLQESKILFTGDHLLPQLVFNPLYDITQDGKFNFNTLKEYENSLENILSLKPKALAPGHRNIILDVEGIIEKRRKYIKNLRLKTAEVILKTDVPLSVFEVIERLNPSTEKWQMLFLFPITLCILHELEEIGEIFSMEENGVTRYIKK